MSQQAAPNIETGRVVSIWLDQNTRLDAIVTAILDARRNDGKQQLELVYWNQASDSIVRQASVPHADFSTPSQLCWDWMQNNEVAEMPNLSVGQSVAYFDEENDYHEAIVTARLDSTTRPALELRWWDRAALEVVISSNIPHRETIGGMFPSWRGLNE